MSSTKIIKADAQNPAAEVIQEAAKIISSGGVVVIPTETVYGVAADSANKSAVARLSQIKIRPKIKPFSLLIDQKDKIDILARNAPATAYKLANKFWPGPLTMILEAKAGGTIGLRMPDNAIALKIIAAAASPLACPSANISGHAAPVEFGAAMKELDGLVDLAIDAGKCRLGAESTIIDLTVKPPSVLREGAIKKQDIEAAIAKKTVLFVCTGNTCRSVIAEGLLKKILKEKNRDDVEVLSAGLAPLEGVGASPETQELLARQDVDVSGHRARGVSRELLDSSDVILVMTRIQEQAVLAMSPEVKNRLFLLKEFAKINDANMDIEDPIGKGRDFYGRIFYIITQAVERIAQVI